LNSELIRASRRCATSATGRSNRVTISLQRRAHRATSAPSSIWNLPANSAVRHCLGLCLGSLTTAPVPAWRDPAAEISRVKSPPASRAPPHHADAAPDASHKRRLPGLARFLRPAKNSVESSRPDVVHALRHGHRLPVMLRQNDFFRLPDAPSRCSACKENCVSEKNAALIFCKRRSGRVHVRAFFNAVRQACVSCRRTTLPVAGGWRHAVMRRLQATNCCNSARGSHAGSLHAEDIGHHELEAWLLGWKHLPVVSTANAATVLFRNQISAAAQLVQTLAAWHFVSPPL